MEAMRNSAQTAASRPTPLIGVTPGTIAGSREYSMNGARNMSR